MAGGQTTAMSAKSTAEVFAILAIGTPSIPSSQMTAYVDAAASFPTLVADIQIALQNGTLPLSAQNIQADLATVLGDTISYVYQQQTTKPFVARPESILPTETATQPLPFQIIGPFPSLKTVASVYIDSPNGDGGVNLKNTLPISFSASSRDLTENSIDNGETLPSFDLVSNILVHLTTSPTATKVSGNGQNFVVTLNTAQTDSANVTKLVTDIILQAINLAIDRKITDSVNLQSCAGKGANQIVSAVTTVMR